jgi:hypothetical protein
MAFATLLAATALAAAAQPRDEERHEDGRDPYRRGYEEGFERGYRKGLEEGEKRARAEAPPPVAPAPVRGPIRVSGAVYGTSSRHCDATRTVARRANGKLSYSFEVTNDLCGDPAHGDRKSLDVTYRCGDVLKSTSANEHRTVYLDCRS